MRKLAGKYAAMGIVVSEVAKATAKQFKGELEAGFAKGQDAYGTPWAPLKAGGASHLRETGAYQASVDAFAVPGVGQSLIELSSGNAASLHAKESKQYAPGSFLEKRSHKAGAAKRMPIAGSKSWDHPARPLMPIDGQELPPKWKEIIGENYAEQMKVAAK